MIRDGKYRDIPQVAKLWYECVADEDQDFGVGYPEQPGKEGLEALLKAAIDSNLTKLQVAETEGDLVGFALAGVVLRPLFRPNLYLSVEILYIKPEHRSPRLARNFVDNLVKWVVGSGVETAELAARPTERQMSRWIRKGWKPYKTVMWRKI